MARRITDPPDLINRGRLARLLNEVGADQPPPQVHNGIPPNNVGDGARRRFAIFGSGLSRLDAGANPKKHPWTKGRRDFSLAVMGRSKLLIHAFE
jgi:hypothetical protein